MHTPSCACALMAAVTALVLLMKMPSGSDAELHPDFKNNQYKIPPLIFDRPLAEHVSQFPINVHQTIQRNRTRSRLVPNDQAQTKIDIWLKTWVTRTRSLLTI